MGLLCVLSTAHMSIANSSNINVKTMGLSNILRQMTNEKITINCMFQNINVWLRMTPVLMFVISISITAL